MENSIRVSGKAALFFFGLPLPFSCSLTLSICCCFGPFLLGATCCTAHLSGNAADYRVQEGPIHELPLTPVGVQAETHRWGSKGHRITVGFDSPRVLQGSAFQVSVHLDSDIARSPVRVSPRLVSNTNAWREDEETDDLYHYLAELAPQAASGNVTFEEGLKEDAEAAAAYLAAAPPRRLQQLHGRDAYASFPPLLPERQKRIAAEGNTGAGEGARSNLEAHRRLEVCPEEFTEREEKRRNEVLKRAGFDADMNCDVEGAALQLRTLPQTKTPPKPQTLILPPPFLPPHSQECNGDAFCGSVYCELVDCSHVKAREMLQSLLWAPQGRWEFDLMFDWAEKEVPLKGELRIEVLEVPPPSTSWRASAGSNSQEDSAGIPPAGNVALIGKANLSTKYKAPYFGYASRQSHAAASRTGFSKAESRLGCSRNYASAGISTTHASASLKEASSARAKKAL
ncbi:hypothetical protein cyc_02700 [Cyclospora cayetanensis]|uniref:Transmembrane protein n=1 Tax=Cyclospora cayetanensis TaxID=88456 RepID=A0A1D3CY55_9EIME|nr:hypothetical protein cyc_02700 [Cyclospora cayetanensis]